MMYVHVIIYICICIIYVYLNVYDVCIGAFGCLVFLYMCIYMYRSFCM